MSDIRDLERRISSALERIGLALDQPAQAAPGGRAQRAKEALQAEREANSQLTERLRVQKDRDGARLAELTEKVTTLTQQLDTQGIELQRMRKTVMHLRETVQSLRESQAGQVAEPHLLNKAMLAELEALRATRLSEMYEMDEILAELKPLIGEPQDA